MPPTSAPIIVRARVEDRSDVDAVLGEDRRARDRLAEPAGSDQGDVVLPLRPQDLADLAEQRVDRVADAALAELAEVREIAADLRRVDVRVVGDLLRGDALLPHLLGLGQHLQIAREPRGDTDREPVWEPRLERELATSRAHCAQGSQTAVRLSQTTALVTLTPAQSGLVDVVDERPLAVDLDDRQPLAVARPRAPASPVMSTASYGTPTAGRALSRARSHRRAAAPRGRG